MLAWAALWPRYFLYTRAARATAADDPTGEFKMNDDETTDQQDAEATEPEQRATDGTGMIWVIAFAVLILAMVLAL